MPVSSTASFGVKSCSRWGCAHQIRRESKMVEKLDDAGSVAMLVEEVIARWGSVTGWRT